MRTLHCFSRIDSKGNDVNQLIARSQSLNAISAPMNCQAIYPMKNARKRFMRNIDIKNFCHLDTRYK